MKRIPDIGVWVRTKPASDLWIPEGSPLAVPYPKISLPAFIRSVEGDNQYRLYLSPVASMEELNAARGLYVAMCGEEAFAYTGDCAGVAIDLGIWDATQFVPASLDVSYKENKDLCWDL